MTSVNSSLTNNFSVTSNENLLDNPWFTINQRGASSYNAVGYTVDRWRASTWNTTSLTVTPQSNGILLAGTASAANTCQLMQYIENPSTLAGKTLTLSAITTNNLSVAAGRLFVYIDGSYYTSGNLSDAANDLTQLTFTMPNSVSSMDIRIGKHASYGGTGDTSLLIKAIKLEVGSVSTLANNTAPDYAIELAKCRASTADSTDTYANQGQIVMDSSLMKLNSKTITNGESITTSVSATTWTDVASITLEAGTYIINAGITLGNSQGSAVTIRFSNSTDTRQSLYVPDTNSYSANLVQIVALTNDTTIYLSAWCASAVVIYGPFINAVRLDADL